jgi:hypothetical protein
VHRFAQDIDSGFQILQLEFTALFAYLRISSHIFATEVYTKAPLWNILLAIFPPVGVRAAAFAAKPVAFVAFVALDLGQILGHPWPTFDFEIDITIRSIITVGLARAC